MFGQCPRKSATPPPPWATDLFRKYVSADWDFVWHVVKPRNGWSAYGCCYFHYKTVECFVSDTNDTIRNRYLILHEITHIRRGIIPVPAYRKNYIQHDEKFFRMAAFLYIENGIDILQYAMENEYKRGRIVLRTAFENVEAFIKDHLHFPIISSKAKQTIAPICSSVGAGTIGWAIFKNQYLKLEIVKVGRVNYLCSDMAGRYYYVGFKFFHEGDLLKTAASKLQDALDKKIMEKLGETS